MRVRRPQYRRDIDHDHDSCLRARLPAGHRVPTCCRERADSRPPARPAAQTSEWSRRPSAR
ncbi:hypothetical protein YT1_5471 [Rhodococcus ruber]|nr:hypothetical protein YT1_5471 [Rhodococcus ruber]